MSCLELIFLARARLTNAGALLLWNRFLLLAQYTDEQAGHPKGTPSPGLLGSVQNYLELKRVNAFLDSYAENDRITKNKQGTPAKAKMPIGKKNMY